MKIMIKNFIVTLLIILSLSGCEIRINTRKSETINKYIEYRDIYNIRQWNAVLELLQYQLDQKIISLGDIDFRDVDLDLDTDIVVEYKKKFVVWLNQILEYDKRSLK